MPYQAEFNRPVMGTLMVQMGDNGEIREVAKEDVEKFGLLDIREAYKLLCDQLRAATTDATGQSDLTKTHLNPIRTLLETVLVFPDEARTESTHLSEIRKVIARMEKALGDADFDPDLP